MEDFGVRPVLLTTYFCFVCFLIPVGLATNFVAYQRNTSSAEESNHNQRGEVCCQPYRNQKANKTKIGFHISDATFPNSYWLTTSWAIGAALCPLLLFPVMGTHPPLKNRTTISVAKFVASPTGIKKQTKQK
jgi:hypothetical protein